MQKFLSTEAATNKPARKAIFLDRDGITNKMVLYESGWDSPQSPDDVVIIDTIIDIISWANKNKIFVIEITNQPGVAKGKMTQEVSDAIEHQIHSLLKNKNAFINKIYICPHHPKGIIKQLTLDCDCRKPKPGLILKAQKELDIDLQKSIFLGDTASDINAGKSAGCKTIIYLHKENEESKVKDAINSGADFRVKSLSGAFTIIKRFFK